VFSKKREKWCMEARAPFSGVLHACTEELKKAGKPSADTLRALLSSSEISIKESKEWEKVLEYTKTVVELFPNDSTVWADLLKKVISEVNSLDQQLSPTLHERCRQVEILLASLADSDVPNAPLISFDGRPGKRKRNGDSRTKLLSHYTLLTEVFPFAAMRTQQSHKIPQLRPFFERDHEAAIPLHWTLEIFMNSLHMRYQNLVDMLTVSGTP